MTDPFLDYVKSVIPAGVLGIFGGFVKLVTGSEKLTIKYAVGSFALAILVALVLDAVTKELHVSSNVWAVTMYMGGYCSRGAIDIIEKKWLSRLERKLDV